MVSINFEGAKQFYARQPDAAAAQAAFDTLVNGTGAGNDFIGWVDLPVNYDKDEFARIQKAAAKIQANSKALVVIGIGGSYLGARAVVELLKSPNYNALPKSTPDIYFAGNGISSDAVTEILTMIGDRDFSVNVISKSGTTTEPAIAFRIFKAALEKKYGAEGAKGRIYATTDKARGALKTLADREGYESFVVPDNVGGRYSVLTAVGLLPIACCGIDIEALMHGAQAEREDTLRSGVNSAAVQYAMSRQALYADGKNIEILAAYEPAFRFMAEWWKQLYGESEGKDGKGIFPASVDLTPDLHSMGQYIQDGIRMLQETVVFFDNSRTSIAVPSDEENLDGLNYLAGREMSYINEKAMQAYQLGYLTGSKTNGKLLAKPGSTISRQEAMTILSRTKDFADADLNVLSAFSDSGKIADWARTALAQMTQQKIISGSKGKLNPTGKVTRAEVAKMLYMLSES